MEAITTNHMFDIHDRILHRLMLSIDRTSEIGLFHGKMGVAIIFAQYSRFDTKHGELYNKIFEDLLDQIFEKIHDQMPISFSYGLSGLGWGIEYLLQNKFVEGDGVEICEAIDKRIIQFDPKRITDLRLESGFEGILDYVLAHIQGAKHEYMPFDNLYYDDLFVALNAIDKSNINERFTELIDSYNQFYQTKHVVLSKEYRMGDLQNTFSELRGYCADFAHYLSMQDIPRRIILLKTQINKHHEYLRKQERQMAYI